MDEQLEQQLDTLQKLKNQAIEMGTQFAPKALTA